MQISVRAAAMRTALERATGEIATAETTGRPGTLRITVPVPANPTDERWAAVLTALRGTARWGATDGRGTPTVWAEIQEET